MKTVASEGGRGRAGGSDPEYEAFLQRENLSCKRSAQNWQERLVNMLRDAFLEKARAQLGNGAVAG